VTVHAIEVTETGGPEVLRNVEQPTPAPGPGEVLIKAEAIGVNFVDTYFRSGAYPHKLPLVLGAEVGGTVEALGDGVTALRVGDRVATAAAAMVTVSRRYPLQEAARAHRDLEGRKTVGSVVLTPSTGWLPPHRARRPLSQRARR
jgi:NADPH:quinone reductase-like Zn-dependent oxidoreductase